ncbi:hypothetical protein F5Y00DRAFT_124606 [Daldinia vernicosa]|uniref:uncharacterized protein n=1 Tax=Daldinia vernicosa TaxID=114800 RepID=UPI0020082087|nr:uncharacterized protein F5Y00DRAFT_124606 [Daldinia vernicosa]KAI0847057.1 hypothetical protein F5Y00DRAFT_124606 [Daldinia vernicosa]
MATSREERMQQRMRGAGRHEVADDSFGFILPGAEASSDPPSDPPPPSSIARSEPNTSAKRRRLNPDADLTSSQPPSSALRASRRTSARLSGSRVDPYAAVQQESPEDASGPLAALSLENQESPNQDETLESMQAVIQRPESRGSVASVASRLSLGHVAEEVTESPAEAPGSGHRRSVRVLPESITRSAKLLKAVIDEEAGATGELAYSSPLARKSRASAATLGAASARSTRTVTRALGGLDIGDIEEPSPAQRSDATAITGSTRSTRSQVRLATPSIVDELSSSPQAAGTASPRKPQPRVKPKPIAAPPEIQVQAAEEETREEEAVADEEEAEAVNVQTAARKIGRKRPRESPPREASPELHSRVEDDRPTKKSRQKKARGSPAVQSQPKPPKKKNKLPPKRRSDGEAIPIIVQRYTKRMHLNEDDTNGDILNADIPFSNRGGVNVIDVLSQVCDEVVESSLETLHEAAVNAKDSATKKEFRTKLRALEAFKEELRTRLLEHTIALDTMHALKKRVRSVQKDKLTLRSEIMRIRAEREQVALKMDAVRMRHEMASKGTLHQLELSSAMDDIELAIENGKSAPGLDDPKEKKAAELSNLELLISRVASQASSGGDGGGSLKQIKDFNAFLERTAAALEGR